ncbi:MAG: glycosyltransferase family 9 protein [Candidatus Omnitrophica bacterium]|jgi:ADP-heptose:LPS heptosyltransferase|nr:glycosyltransferase family 9 protein [Candidatus Omnitrophota bacterium]
MNKKEIKNFFFIRSDRLGEFLLSLYAIKLVKFNYPDSKIYLLAKKDNVDLVMGIDFVDHFIEYKNDVFEGFSGAFNLSNILRKEKIDCVISLNPKKEFHLASLLAAVPLRLGYNRKWGFCLNRKIEDKKHLVQKHEVEYNFDLVKLICKDIFTPSFDLTVDKLGTLNMLSGCLNLSQKYIVIHPFSSNPSKQIEIAYWTRLVSALKEKCAGDIVLIGSKEEMPESEVLAEKLDIKNVTGKLSLRNLASFLKHNCSLFIGLDSGPMHLASILKRPVVGLFKISNSRRWGPFDTQSLIVEGVDLSSFLAKSEDILKFACANSTGKI